jgi:hypothetical protein
MNPQTAVVFHCQAKSMEEWSVLAELWFLSTLPLALAVLLIILSLSQGPA